MGYVTMKQWVKRAFQQGARRLAMLCTVASLSFFSALLQAAPESEVIGFWKPSNESNTASIDHSDWQYILTKYINDQHPSKVNRFDYKGVNKADRKRLQKYLADMQKLDPRKFSKAEQFAYWVNLYNALTVEVILDNYPTPSITKLGEGLFSFGPWDDEVARIQGQDLTLNNIEHGILRPIWQDNRIHYAVNCASIGCPNLSKEVFTAANTEAQLEKAAKDYINHPRGVRFDGNQLIVSSIFNWYKVDFGDSDNTLLLHLSKYANPELKAQLTRYNGSIEDFYDWDLNQP